MSDHVCTDAVLQRLQGVVGCAGSSADASSSVRVGSPEAAGSGLACVSVVSVASGPPRSSIPAVKLAEPLN